MTDPRQTSRGADNITACSKGVTAAALSRVPVISGLPLEDLEWIRRHTRHQQQDAGLTLYRQDDQVHHLFYLKSGSVKIFRRLRSGQTKVMEIVNAGAFLALSALFLPRHTYPETAEALEHCDLFRFEATPLFRALQTHPSTCLKLLEYMSRRLEQKKQEIALLAESPAGSRLLQLLLEEIPEQAQKDGQFNVQASKQDIASRIAVKPETLSRLLKKMAGDGVLRNTTRGIVVTNVAELRRQASRV